MVRFYAGLAAALHGETIDNSLTADIVSYTLKEPVGVVGAIIPWNNPHGAAIWKVCPASAAGCTVVLKPSEEASLSSIWLGELLLEAGLPPGVLNVVPGYGRTAGAALAGPISTWTRSPSRAPLVHWPRDREGLGWKSQAGVARARGEVTNIVLADADLEQAVPPASHGGVQ